MIHSFDSSFTTMLLVLEPWRRSKGKSFNGADGTQSLSRLLRAKNDKETIAAWWLELNRILHVFNVRLVVFAWLLLIVPFQAELAINAHTMLVDMYRNALAGHENTEHQNNPVSATFYPSIAEC